MNAFGFGGTNCHVVVQEHRAADPGPADAPRDVRPEPRLLTLSAHTGEALQAMAREMLPYLAGEDAASLADICYTRNLRRAHLEHRLALLASSPGEAIDGLHAFLHGRPHPGLWTGRDRRPDRRLRLPATRALRPRTCSSGAKDRQPTSERMKRGRPSIP